MSTFEELDVHEITEEYSWKIPKTFPQLNTGFKTLRESLLLSPLKHRGFVICDNNFNRVEVTSPQYVIIRNMKVMENRGSVTNDELLELVIRTCKTDVQDLCKLFLRFSDDLKTTTDVYWRFCDFLSKIFIEIEAISDRKILSDKMKSFPYEKMKSILFGTKKEQLHEPVEFLRLQTFDFVKRNLEIFLREIEQSMIGTVGSIAAISPENKENEAKRMKEFGNEKFKNGMFRESIEFFSKAMEILSSCASAPAALGLQALYTNRSLANFNLVSN